MHRQQLSIQTRGLVLILIHLMDGAEGFFQIGIDAAQHDIAKAFKGTVELSLPLFINPLPPVRLG
ncbi:hypothetical protein V462_09845 [Pantoea ananatis 15320]|nr:hypothetical protein V462_09845 [Pantoea ananatis 15320]